MLFNLMIVGNWKFVCLKLKIAHLTYIMKIDILMGN